MNLHKKLHNLFEYSFGLFCAEHSTLESKVEIDMNRSKHNVTILTVNIRFMSKNCKI